MSDFNTLQELGSKTISSATHIPVAHVDNILNKKFDQFQKPQFFGFVSILEREYKLDLSGLKQEFLFEKAEHEVVEESNFDIAEKSSQVKALLENKKVVYGVVGTLVTLLIIALLSSIDFSSENETKIEINNTAIDQAKKNLKIKPVEVNNVEAMMNDNDVESAEFGQDEQASKPDAEVTVAKAEKKEATKEPVSNAEPTMSLYFRIIPKGRLWLGIIDTETHRRRVETITEPLILDAEKSWLIVTGYGHLDMDCGDTTQKFRQDHKLLFLYEDGICQVIDKEDFKAQNRGKLW